ncbi:hypothetical protein SBRY_10438 [Actinacidiphila bryophytorum]|uniref:Uncharacterized protein n=1 Tax=Actinacidiphila bryophytorum TaxID=1436133 RepID=A0A9W4E1Z6_9ACTN|nr:hypothetical protein SBRY_10438 [Actinacidiphila bryophytorum]
MSRTPLSRTRQALTATGHACSCALPYAGPHPRLPYPRPHVALRRLRRQPRRPPDDPPRTALPAARHRLARRLAADLRRRADGLGGRARHPGRGPGQPGLRRSVRHRAGRRGVDGPLGGRTPADLPAHDRTGAHPGRRPRRVALRAQRLRGRAAVGPLPRRDRRRRGVRGGAARLRDGPAQAALLTGPRPDGVRLRNCLKLRFPVLPKSGRLRA